MNQAFTRLDEGYELAMKEYNKKQMTQLKALIDLLLDSKLPHGDREKIMTICTIDVHARDIVAKLIQNKVSWRKSLFNLVESAKFQDKTAGWHRHIFRPTTNILIKFCKRFETKLLF